MTDTTRLVLKVLLVGFFLLMDCMFISRLLLNHKTLKSVTGYIMTQSKIHVHGGKSSYDAVILGLDSGSLQYAIMDHDEHAYNYLLDHDLYKQRVTILYDQNGYNSDKDLTYHVYELTVGNTVILSIQEAKHQDKIFLIIGIPFEILLVWFMFFSKYSNRQITT